MPEIGDFVELRGRRWLVEVADTTGSDLAAIRLSCISDDAQGESLEVLWDAEISPQHLDDNSWRQIGRGAPDTAEVLAAHIRAIRWNTATAEYERGMFPISERPFCSAPARSRPFPGRQRTAPEKRKAISSRDMRCCGAPVRFWRSAVPGEFC
jgi:hypothetical protein